MYNQSLPISNVNVPGGSNVVATSTFPRSVPLSQLIKIGKLIPPKKDIATLQLALKKNLMLRVKAGKIKLKQCCQLMLTNLQVVDAVMHF